MDTCLFLGKKGRVLDVYDISWFSDEALAMAKEKYSVEGGRLFYKPMAEIALELDNAETYEECARIQNLQTAAFLSLKNFSNANVDRDLPFIEFYARDKISGVDVKNRKAYNEDFIAEAVEAGAYPVTVTATADNQQK